MRKVGELFAERLRENPLNVLVFGPAVDPPSDNTFVRALQIKRQEIRVALENDGHFVQYGEEVIDPSLPPPADNPLFQEFLAIQEFDVVVILVQSPGTIAESTLLALRPEIAPKAHLFMRDEHRGGFVWQACKLAEQFNAVFAEFTFPADLVECHLLTKVRDRLIKMQVAKMLG
jgi:hypothetical protein